LAAAPFDIAFDQSFQTVKPHIRMSNMRIHTVNSCPKRRVDLALSFDVSLHDLYKLSLRLGMKLNYTVRLRKLLCQLIEPHLVISMTL
jgi:hypothetical protein